MDILYIVKYGSHSPYEGDSADYAGVFSSKNLATNFIKSILLTKLTVGRIQYKRYGDEWCDRDPNEGYSFDFIAIEEVELDPVEFY